MRQPGEDDVLEDGSGQEQVERRPPSEPRTAESGSKRRVGYRVHVRHTTLYRYAGNCISEARRSACIDCRHAAHDCRRRRIPGTPGLPGALRGSFRRAGAGTGAVRRRPRPGSRPSRRSWRSLRRSRAARAAVPRSVPPTSLPEALDRHGHGLRRDPPRRDGRPHRRRAGGPGPGTPGPGNHGRRRHLLRACGPSPACCELAEEMRRHCPDAWLLNFTNPAGMVTEALVPVLGPQGGRDLRLSQRPGAPCGAGCRRRAAGGLARRRGLLRPEPPRLAVPAGVRRPGLLSRAARGPDGAAGVRGRPVVSAQRCWPA